MAVYFIRAGEDGPVKIGYAGEPKRRMRSLQSGNWIRLHLIRELPGDLATERFFHELYADRRRAFEWYEFCPSMLVAEPGEPLNPPRLRYLNYTVEGCALNHAHADARRATA